MSNRHTGNTQPSIDQEEHVHISNIAGKKSFTFDSSGNQITDFGGNYKDPILEMAAGNISGISQVNKFGNAPDFDTGDGEVTIWDGANDGGINAMSYSYSSSADIDTISSSNAGDDQTIEIQGLDSSYNTSTQTATLNGQNKVTLTTDLIRVFRLKNTGSTNNAGDVYCYVNGDITAGVPDTAGDVRAVIRAGMNQTLMAVYTVPNGKTGYVTGWYAWTQGANKTADFDIYFRARPTGEVFQVKHLSTINDTAEVGIQHLYVPYNKFVAKTDLEMRCDVTTVGITAAGISAGFDIILVDD